MTNDYGNLELHQVLLAAMKDIDKICRENGLKYFLYAGTLLGAVQHKGFIPWDDDIDLAMFPEDFQKFAQIIDKQYSQWYQVCTYENTPDYHSAGIKLYLKGTRLSYEGDRKSTPLFIDICLLHSVPKSRLLQTIQRKQLEWIYMIWGVQSGFIVPSSFASKMTIGLLAKIDCRFWGRQYDRVCSRYDRKKTEYVATMFGMDPNPYNGKNGYDKDITPRNWHENPVDIPFEDCMFMTLAEPIADVDSRYPNWRKPMPKKERKSKHGVKEFVISDELRNKIFTNGATVG